MMNFEKEIKSTLGVMAWPFAILNAIAFFVGYIVLVLWKRVRDTVPINYAILGLMTLSSSISTGITCQEYTIDSVGNCMTMTGFMVLAIAVYTLTTKRDFTMFSLFACVLGVDLVYFLIWVFMGFHDSAYILYGIAGCTAFSGYLAYDIQLIMGGKRRSLEIDDYILGALIIYMDIINLFIEILKLFGEKKDDKKDKDEK